MNPSQFGRDHWSTLLYIESCCTDNGGKLDHRRMRCDRDRHPLFAHMPPELEGTKYPTRLAAGTEQADHDDWDCADDLVEAGYLELKGTGTNPRFEMTVAGMAKAMELRAQRQARSKAS